MLIGFDGSRAFSVGNDEVLKRTGTENYAYYLLKNLAKIDKHNRYLVYLRSNSAVNLAEWPSNFEFRVLNFPRLWTQVGLALRTFLDKIDVLFVPSHTLPLLRRPGLKTVMTVHDLGAEYLPQMHQIKQRLYLGVITKWQLKTSSKLIAISQATKDDLIKRAQVSPSNIVVIYEGVNRNIYFPESNVVVSKVLDQFKLKKQQYFIYIGTIQPRKNLVRVIEAFAQFLARNKDFKLVLVGKKGWLAQEIYAAPDKFRVAKDILFLGYQPDEISRALLTGATAMVYPSLFEGFGLPILESFACRCPVITSNLSSMPEVAGEGAILVDPYQIKQITLAMEKVQEVEFRTQILKKAQQQLEKFTWKQSAQKTLQLLEEVVNG